MVSSCDNSPRPVCSCRWPCGVCGHGVGVNSILCRQCRRWIHKKCSGVSGSLAAAARSFVCKTCLNPSSPGSPNNDQFVVHDQEFESVQSFCYLGDTLSASGGSDLAVTTRVRCAWKKFHELAAFLTSRATPLKIKGRVYAACVRSVMTYASETWAMKGEQQAKLERTDNAMVRKMCGVTLRERKKSEDLRKKLCLPNIGEVLRRSRLRWFGHVERRDNAEWIRKVSQMEVEGRRSVGRPRKTWAQTIMEDLRVWRLDPTLANSREQWRLAVETSVQPRRTGTTDVKRQ